MKKKILLTGITASLFALGAPAHSVMFPILVKQKTEAQSYTNSIGMIFNLVPAGTFTMGSYAGGYIRGFYFPPEPGRDSNETQHQVTLTKSFYMQITEVTNKQWNTVIFDTGLGVLPSESHTGDNYPVETVNWFEAAYFANALSSSEGRSECYDMTGCSPTPGNNMECSDVVINSNCTGYRLPTEAQWEYAARATTTTAYANPVYFDTSNSKIYNGFDSNLAAMGWYSWNNTLSGGYPNGTKPVAAKQANKWGLFDMHGNVYEWCQDWWDGLAYSPDPVTNPQGDVTGSDRVFRGGSWYDSAGFARSADRTRFTPGDRYYDLGFRLVLPPGQ